MHLEEVVTPRPTVLENLAKTTPTEVSVCGPCTLPPLPLWGKTISAVNLAAPYERMPIPGGLRGPSCLLMPLGRMRGRKGQLPLPLHIDCRPVVWESSWGQEGCVIVCLKPWIASNWPDRGQNIPLTKEDFSTEISKCPTPLGKLVNFHEFTRDRKVGSEPEK